MSTKAPNPVDKYVGSRVRMRRIMLGMSQEKLGEALGLTFQQVQKYEKGTNRIGASRLSRIAEVLGISVGELFETPGSAAQDSKSPANSPLRLLSGRDELRVLTAYSRIADPRLRRAIVELVESAADRRPEPAPARKRQPKS